MVELDEYGRTELFDGSFDDLHVNEVGEVAAEFNEKLDYWSQTTLVLDFWPGLYVQDWELVQRPEHAASEDVVSYFSAEVFEN